MTNASWNGKYVELDKYDRQRERSVLNKLLELFGFELSFYRDCIAELQIVYIDRSMCASLLQAYK